MGLGQKFLTWVRSGQPSLVWVCVWKISLKNSKLSNFLPFGSKNLIGSGQNVHGSKPGQPFIYCRSKVCSGRIGSGSISSECWFGLGMGLGQNFLTWVGYNFGCLGWDESGQLAPVQGNFPYLCTVGSKKSDWVGTKNNWFGILYTTAQQYPRLGSGHDPSLVWLTEDAVWYI